MEGLGTWLSGLGRQLPATRGRVSLIDSRKRSSGGCSRSVRRGHGRYTISAGGLVLHSRRRGSWVHLSAGDLLRRAELRGGVTLGAERQSQEATSPALGISLQPTSDPRRQPSVQDWTSCCSSHLPVNL